MKDEEGCLSNPDFQISKNLTRFWNLTDATLLSQKDLTLAGGDVQLHRQNCHI